MPDSDYTLPVQDRVKLQTTICNTTVCDGERDIVQAIVSDVRGDVAAVAGAYGKYVVYGVAGLIGFQLVKLWWERRGD